MYLENDFHLYELNCIFYIYIIFICVMLLCIILLCVLYFYVSTTRKHPLVFAGGK